MMWIHFTAGRGPGECQIACKNLTEIFIKEAEALDYDVSLIEAIQGPHGYLSALVSLETIASGGQFPLALSWEGTIQWICESPIRQGWKRKNWFVSVTLVRPPSPTQNIHMRDCKFETFRASGPGGQHVQKTDSAVRVTHIPTGLVAQAQEERSQYRNKSLAFARLLEMMAKKQNAEIGAAEQEKWANHDDLIRGNPVRIYRGINFKKD